MDAEQLKKIAALIMQELRAADIPERRAQAASLHALYAITPAIGDGTPPDIVLPATFDAEYRAYAALAQDGDLNDIRYVYGRDDLDADDLLAQLAALHEVWADALWASLPVADGWRCAYHYQLAGRFFARSAHFTRSAWAYHHAGNKFQVLIAWEHAAEAYRCSAEAAEKAGDNKGLELARRSARRAIFCYKQVEENEIAEAVAQRFLE
jgi:hypothetical protein